MTGRWKRCVLSRTRINLKALIRPPFRLSQEKGSIVSKVEVTSDEAQFASQFNGSRSVQQIAKNLRLD